MTYKLYKGYILGPGEQHPAMGVYEVNIYQRFDAAKDYVPFHTSESEYEAELWIDSRMGYDATGWATQADVDELNEVTPPAGYVDPNHKMEIEVSPSAVFTDVADWTRDHATELENAIKDSVKGIGFPGWVSVKIGY